MNILYLIISLFFLSSAPSFGMFEVRQARRAKSPATVHPPKKDLSRKSINSRRDAEQKIRQKRKPPTRPVNAKNTAQGITILQRNAGLPKHSFNWETPDADHWYADLIFTNQWWHKFQQDFLTDIPGKGFIELKGKFDAAVGNLERLNTQSTKIEQDWKLSEGFIKALKDALNHKPDLELIEYYIEYQAINWELELLNLQ